MTPQEFDEAETYWTSREADSKRMPQDELRKAVDGFLSSHNTCALACGAGDFVRCTPLEYAYRDGAFWIFSEGGLKFRALRRNTNVSLAVFEPYSGFGKLESAQVTGTVTIVDPGSPEFAKAAAEKGIPANMLDKLRSRLHLIKVEPTRIDYLCSALKEHGYDPRQWLEP
ncbi:MAG: pyridoxamine 5'-phosphate oxidase family protein [Parafannyhessea sp.]|uniref:pyridoxamine 5'-phosphate oxidase family protein n=1 Tax=Parafannyhessea sp. TaxID=2847324 RepID=UPI003F0CC4DE